MSVVWPANVTVSKRASHDFDDIDDPDMQANILTALAKDLRPVPNPPKIVRVKTISWPRALLLTVPDPDFWSLYYYQAVEDDDDQVDDDQADDEDNIMDDYLVLYRNLTRRELEGARRLGLSVRYRVARILPRSQFSAPFPQV
jgi:hypothetical protein